VAVKNGMSTARRPAAGEPVSRTGRQRKRGAYTLLIWQALLGLALLGIWQAISGPIVDPFWISRPSLVAASLAEQYRSGTLVSDITVTLQNTLIGYVLGAGTGVILGFTLASARKAADVLNPYIIAVYGIPRIALAPLVIVWFGIGAESKIFLAAIMALFLTFFNTYTGVRSVDRGLVNVARVMGADRWQMTYKVVFPAASPWIIAGLRISIPNALVSEVVGEFIAAQHGLGYRIVYYANTFNTTGTMAGVLILMVLVLMLNRLLDWGEGHLLRWMPRGPTGAET